jgi:hypothetical protein
MREGENEHGNHRPGPKSRWCRDGVASGDVDRAPLGAIRKSGNLDDLRVPRLTRVEDGGT